MENPYQTPAAVVASAAPPAPQFKDPTWLTWAARACLIASAVISGATIAVTMQQYALLKSAETGQITLDDVYDQSLVQLALVGLPQLVVTVASFVLIAMWIYRVAWNARVFAGARNMDFTPGWSVGWYFVPFVNLWKPYQAMKEVWRASANPSQMDRTSVSWWLPLWWLLWLANNIVGNYAGRAAWRADTVSEEIDSALASITADAINIPLCLVFLLIVNRVFRMQWQQRLLREEALAG
jgi:hypothetical protein